MNVWEWLRLQWDRLAATVSIAAGLLAIVLGYIGISGTVYPAEQLPYILSGGILGVFLLGLGSMLWLSADVRDEWRKLDVMEKKLDALDATRLAAVSAGGHRRRQTRSDAVEQ